MAVSRASHRSILPQGDAALLHAKGMTVFVAKTDGQLRAPVLYMLAADSCHMKSRHGLLCKVVDISVSTRT